MGRSDLISTGSNRFGVFRFFNSRCFLLPCCSDRFGVFRLFKSRWLFLPCGSDRFGVFGNCHCRRFLLPCSSDRLSIFRNFNSRSWFVPLACSWLLLVNLFLIFFSKDGYDRTACGSSLDSISFNRFFILSISTVRDWDLNLIVLD